MLRERDGSRKVQRSGGKVVRRQEVGVVMGFKRSAANAQVSAKMLRTV